MNISLIGFSGTGKTAVSKLIARRLDKKLISTDDEISKRARLSMEKLVKKYGWQGLREAESSIIEDLSDLDECVFDTGSGVVLRNENIINLKKNGLVVLLTADINVTANRLKRQEKFGNMPDAGSVLRECEEKHKKAADYAIDTSNLSPEEACDLIIHYVQMELQ